jgi:hypothetical protein
MITDENHPEMQAALKQLIVRLEFYVGRDVTRGLIDSYRRILKEHQQAWRLKGVDFPTMVLVVVPRLGIIHTSRADLDLPSIKQSIVNFVRAYPDATMLEVVHAFQSAYPGLHPDDLRQAGLIIRLPNGGTK